MFLHLRFTQESILLERYLTEFSCNYAWKHFIEMFLEVLLDVTRLSDQKPETFLPILSDLSDQKHFIKMIPMIL